MDQWLTDLVAAAEAGNPADLAASRASLDLAVSERLLNTVVAARLPPGGPVQTVTIRPQPGRARVTIRLRRPAFLPPLAVSVTVERQPELPGTPELVLRLELPAAMRMLLGLGARLAGSLPPGVRLDGDLVFVDLAALLARQDLAWVLRYARALEVTFEDGRVRVRAAAEA